jgi:serine/threonine protein kinase
MTNNYRTSLGRGAFGEVYEGVLEDGSMVAVKRLIGSVKEKFAKELIIHREINHKNVVRLIGYCVEENALVLVMEYIANGNLNDVLHDDNRPILLDIRLRIAIECAEALAYMHSHMYTQVIHGDIKPGNILLDSNFHAKLSDFGISRVANTDKTLYTENVIGSIGYMDPLFSLDGRLTVKYDVYSFGAVLVELITRKKAVVENVNNVYAFSNALTRGVRGVRDMLDVDIASKNNLKVLEGVAKLAGECLRMERDKRPEMIDVAERLRVLWKSSYQDQERQRVNLFSWVRKSIPAPPALVNTRANILPSGACRQFSLAEMKFATNNFDKSLLVGEVGSGRVYCGQINGRKTNVAIKCIDNYDPNCPQRIVNDFYTEIEMMSKYQHRHLVPLIGYCIEEDAMILVYDYMASGNLHDQLHGEQKPPLTWRQRIEICIGAARGLHYLHEQHIIHRDLTMKKILLDEEWVAKITDLSLSRTGTSVETLVAGTVGYLDPEYCHTSVVTEKSDVYSFGVVLLETLSAQHPYDSICQVEQGLSRWALGCKEGNLDQIVDPYLMGKVNLWSLNKFVEIVLRCVAPKGIDRPSMGDVISDLEHALQWQERADASECASILPSRLCRQFWLAEMEAATNNFDKSLLIDSGLFDQVYSGKIDGVAITLVDVTHVYNVCTFHGLIEITSKLVHGHLVPLIGYCDEQDMMLLVYEYVAGGNLSEHLYGTRKPPLNWIQRMEICIGVARGLCYLHGLQLTHGAVRTSNILLDEECLAKITNLVLPPNLLDNQATKVRETDGYIDPEYLHTDLRTEKLDVYCFGLVLLEVLFGRPVIKHQRLEEQVAWLVSWAVQWPTMDYLDQNVDPFLRGEINPQCLKKFFETAVKCLAEKGIHRPSMRDVLSDLDYALELNERLESIEEDYGGCMSDDDMNEGR